VAVLQFKFDESYDGRFMTVGGWLGEEDEWLRLEKSWQHCIDRTNFNNNASRQISRFHATDMNGYYRDFANWTPEMSARFASKLIGFIAKRRMGGITIGADMEALKDAFREGDQTRKDYAYVLCMKTAMVEIVHLMREYFAGDTVRLIHDHGNWDQQALSGYNLMVNDERWGNRELFNGITSLTAAQSVGLQAADMIAFEGHKALRGRLVYNSETLRKAMQTMQAKGIPIVGKYIDVAAARALKQIMDESGRYEAQTN
jgi:hypothetical protein